MKIEKCQKCNNETYQEDRICVLCKIGVTPAYNELIELIMKDNQWSFQKQKIATVK